MPDSQPTNRGAGRHVMAAALILASILTGFALAEDEGAAPDPSPAAERSSNDAAPAARGERSARGDQNVNLKEVEIRGELERPKIFFILPKAQRDAETKQRRIRFYPDILEPLDKDRFEEEARVLYQHGIPAE